MNRLRLTGYLELIDRYLEENAVIYVYGAAAFILLGEEERASLDIDVAGPYSRVNQADFRAAAEKAGLAVNPEENLTTDHVEWISPVRLCLPPPHPDTEMVLWQGGRLAIKTVSPAQLVASKLIRYDEVDQSDVRYLCLQKKLDFDEIMAAARTLPKPFDTDALVLENLKNLQADMALWQEVKP
jgi:hypothetical protein